MKTKLTGLLIMMSIAIISCNTDFQGGDNELLTSTNWTAVQKPLINGEMPKFSENSTFHKDGKYTFEAGEMKVTGEWKWTKKDEIYLELKTISLNNIQENFDGKQNYYLRILEVSENNLKTLERFETDSWDSGFAKEKTYNRI